MEQKDSAGSWNKLLWDSLNFPKKIDYRSTKYQT
ncbi:hypothetical protein SAMN05216167_101526 [Spirosoma endophyticum]|uniref:Uncharacterized protein n=1 Tax=Spirosoma endophyticum TaxID=662367 RepID=A0A1I1GP92_9BACT|nr:hypothetical protein SAMN05216167_101526 [Spirosoma endophyticum]